MRGCACCKHQMWFFNDLRCTILLHRRCGHPRVFHLWQELYTQRMTAVNFCLVLVLYMRRLAVMAARQRYFWHLARTLR